MAAPDASAELSHAIALLRAPRSIRARAEQLLSAAERGELRHFALDLSQLPRVAQLTAAVTRRRYPELHVPEHSRFAHFDAGGVPRTARLERALEQYEPLERARRMTELVVTSVLLDAGAGARWRFADAESGSELGRSEGLAVASLEWAQRGGLSSRAEAYGVDAAGLLAVDERALAHAFQVSTDNPLVGVPGRVHLLQALGRTLLARRDVFGSAARIGGLCDCLLARAGSGALPAPLLLATLLDSLGTIWPGRLALGPTPLGDVWRHAAVGGEGASAGLLPLHKLSQWLCYSLLRPLRAAGLEVTELEQLTGLAEYRNGGLFLDGGVLVPKHAGVLSDSHEVGSELVVEWRGLTVALLDRLAPLVRSELGLSAAQLPLAAVLEGGTWAAGRELAQRLRADGASPIRVQSDGTVF